MNKTKTIKVLESEIKRVGDKPVLKYFDFYKKKLETLRRGVEKTGKLLDDLSDEKFTCGEMRLSDILEFVKSDATGGHDDGDLLYTSSDEFIRRLHLHRFNYSDLKMKPIDVQESKDTYERYREENREAVEKYEKELKEAFMNYIGSMKGILRTDGVFNI